MFLGPLQPPFLFEDACSHPPVLPRAHGGWAGAVSQPRAQRDEGLDPKCGGRSRDTELSTGCPRIPWPQKQKVAGTSFLAGRGCPCPLLLRCDHPALLVCPLSPYRTRHNKRRCTGLRKSPPNCPGGGLGSWMNPENGVIVSAPDVVGGPLHSNCHRDDGKCRS